MLSSKINQSGYNLGYGLDGIFNLSGSDYLTTSWVQTFDTDSSYSSIIDNSKIRINWEKRVIAGFGYNLDFFRVGEKYNPEIGFELRRGVYRLGNRIFYGWNPENAKRLLRH
jgi:hypothetical protein